MIGRRDWIARRLAYVAAVTTVALGVFVGVVAASNVAIGLTEQSGDVDTPTWLFLATGGGVIGASALLSMLVTDRVVIDRYHDRTLSVSIDRLRRLGSTLLAAVGLLALALVIVVGFVGPQIGSLSAAVLVTFVGLRALLPMVAYLVGNPWPALNPWRQIAEVLPNGYAEYPSWLASWPAVAGVLALVWIEIVAPVSSSPRVLASIVLVYSVVTVAGAVVFTPAIWFRKADPISVLFRLYGAVAPLQRTDSGIELRPPGSRLADDDVGADLSIVAFTIALVWELTYSGFIVTPAGAFLVESAVGIGLPPALVYLAILIAGFGLFCWVYWLATGRTRRRAKTYRSRHSLAIRFAPPLLAIAAGYHVAHYLGFAISLWPSLAQTASAPLSPPTNPTILLLPGWFGYVEIAGILLGHSLAIWVAHTVSFEMFPGRLQAVRSQYPIVAVMVLFTMLSLWLLSMPTIEPPYAAG